MIDKISDIIIDIAQHEILPRFKNLKAEEITAKSSGDMVSIADIETEMALIKVLNQMFPTALVAGEESIAKNSALLPAVISAPRAFLIDPVDGTNNFIKGDPRFALMVTELQKGQVVAAWIYLPVSNVIAVSSKGAGSYLNGKKVKIPSLKMGEKIIPGDLNGAAHINRFPPELRKIAQANLKQVKENRPAFCAGYDYISLLEGVKDFSVYYQTLPWDHLPGGFIFAEAGGYVRTLRGEKPYNIHDQDRGLLSAVDQNHWLQIREMIFPGCF